KAFKDGKETLKKERQVKVAETHRGLVISVPGNTFFDPDEYRLKPEGRRVLEKVAIFLLNMKKNARVDNQVEIEAHASLEPDSVSDKRLGISDIWLKNLDLTTNRAKEVEKFLINEFMRRKNKPVIQRDGRQYAKFVAKGYGEFQPLESNDTPKQRAANRRVDIVIKRD
ncbi:MAG: OmpA family protein, partial [Spirochaetota bacterium]|nr:OmpA family protein [Spirochaetota bacterium]